MVVRLLINTQGSEVTHMFNVQQKKKKRREKPQTWQQYQ